MAGLEGKRILLVEDEFLLAELAEEMLSDLGAMVVGPAATLAKAVTLAQSEVVDAAVLDLNINGKRIDPVTDVLRARGIPIVFATGYAQEAAACSRCELYVGKPYTHETLGAALSKVTAAQGQPDGPSKRSSQGLPSGG